MIYQAINILSKNSKDLKLQRKDQIYVIIVMHIILKGTIDLLADTANKIDKVEDHVVFKNKAPFRSCISKINSTFINNAEDLDIAMLMYNLLEYS